MWAIAASSAGVSGAPGVSLLIGASAASSLKPSVMLIVLMVFPAARCVATVFANSVPWELALLLL